jgi:hypothetical protein
VNPLRAFVDALLGPRDLCNVHQGEACFEHVAFRVRLVTPVPEFLRGRVPQSMTCCRAHLAAASDMLLAHGLGEVVVEEVK